MPGQTSSFLLYATITQLLDTQQLHLYFVMLDEILGRICFGQDTEADRKKINESFLGLKEVELPVSGACYAVATNKQRNV